MTQEIPRRPVSELDIVKLCLLACVLLLPASARAEGRQNPFLPTSTAAEDSAINRHNEVVKEVRGLLPQLTDILEKRLQSDRDSIITEIEKHEAGQKRPTPSLPAPQKTAQTSLRLIACSGGKAIYRDTSRHETVTFKPGDPDMPKPSPCSDD